MNKPVVELDGTKRWYSGEQLHREDGPAVEYVSGSKAWYYQGMRHRDDGPAVELKDGSKQWWLNGVRHRTDGAAVEEPNGLREWWVNGRRERTNAPVENQVGEIGMPKSADSVPSRSKEKHDFWWRKFRHRDVVEVFKNRLFDVFNNQCFRCGRSDRLHIDHHLPRTLGGKLEAGNLVILCERCNNAKGTIAPDVFYGERLLSRLTPLLEAQKAIFEFEWDWNSYNRDKRAYFVSLGVPAATIEKIFGDPDYDGYIELDSEKPSYTISLSDINYAALKRMFKSPAEEK